MRLSIVISAIDRLSAPVKKIAGNVDRMAAKSTAAATRLSGRFDRISSAARATVAPIAAAGAAVQRMSARGVQALRRLDQRFDLVNRSAYGFGRVIGSTLRTGVLATAAIGGAVATAGIAGIVRAGVEWEQFQASMETAVGSVGGANKAMAWVQEFAKQTPYSLSQVMDAFIQAKNKAIDPTSGSLRTLGDAASGVRRDLGDAIEMLADLKDGQFERGLDFGITGSAKGNKVMLSYTNRQFKEVVKTVDRGKASVERAVLSILDEKFAGGMDRQSRTVAGKWANLMDNMGTAARKVWTSGVGDLVNRYLGRLLEWSERIQKDGSLDRWAKQAAEWIEKLTIKAEELITNVDWGQVGRDLSQVAKAVGELASGIVRIAQISDLPAVRLLNRFNPLTGGLVGSFMSGRSSAPPVAPPARRSNRPWTPGPPITSGRLGVHPNRSAQPARVGGAIDVRIHTEPGTKATVTKLSSVNPAVPLSVTRGPVRFG